MKIKVFFRKDHHAIKAENKPEKLGHVMKYLFFFFVFIIPLTGCTSNKKGEVLLGTFSINTGNNDRVNTPIRFECKLNDIFGDTSGLRLPESYYKINNETKQTIVGDHQLLLYEKGGKKSKLSAQWEPKACFNCEETEGQGALVWILDGKTQKGSVRTFKLVLKKAPPPSGDFSIEDIDNKKLIIKNGTRPVLQYNYGIIHEVDGQVNAFDKSSYIHPVWTPSGEIITGDFSPEHIWQRGIYLAWKKVKFGEIETNFWELGKSTGRTLKDNRNPGFIKGPVFSEIVVYNKGTVEGETHFKEICIVKVYNQAKQDSWMFDMFFRQVPVDPENPDSLPGEIKTMELQKVYYGGMSFRGVSPGWLHHDFIAQNEEQLLKFKKDTKWLPPNDSLNILTSEGYNRKNGNGTPARWIDYTGPLGDNWGGLVMFDNPSNKRYPTPLRIHPYMPYFCFAFAKDNPYTITSEASLNLTYRVVVHNGPPNKEANEQIANDFVNPPQVTWEPMR